MKNNNHEQKLMGIFSVILDLPINKLSSDSNVENLKEWDSLSHVQLIMAIENEFRISLSPDEALAISSIKGPHTLRVATFSPGL